MFTHVLAPLRWKQHEAYVQVLEAKYTELCCKYICCYINVIQYNVKMISPASNNQYMLRAIFGCLWCFFWCTFFPFLPLFAVLANDVTGLKESEEKLKQQQQESARRENILVMRLATKEQEMQECTVCVYSSTLMCLIWLWVTFFLLLLVSKGED